MKIKKTLLILFMILSAFSVVGCVNIPDIVDYLNLDTSSNESTIEIRTNTTTSTGDEVGVVRITEVTGETKTLTLTYRTKR